MKWKQERHHINNLRFEYFELGSPIYSQLPKNYIPNSGISFIIILIDQCWEWEGGKKLYRDQCCIACEKGTWLHAPTNRCVDCVGKLEGLYLVET